MAVLGAIVDEEQDRRRGNALHQAVEQGLRLRVDPVEVLQHQDERLDLALAEEQPLHGIERELPTLGRLEVSEAVVLGQGVEQPENRRDQVLECLVEGEEMPGRLGANRADVVALVDTEIRFQEIDDGEIAGGLAIRDGAGLQDPAPSGR